MAMTRGARRGLVLGHEFVGTVAESAAAGFESGTCFAGNPLITCSVCDYCVQGRNNLCANRTMVGMTRPGPARRLCRIHGHSGSFPGRHAAGHA